MTKTTTTETTPRRPLIAGVLRKTLTHPEGAQGRQPGFTDEECRHVRAAARDGRDVRERTVDHIVERLLNELTW